MRSSKNRSRSKSNRQRSIGNIVNRVFDSSGPEGKVRGTPQQIIDKYLMLARDAQLGNDRVAEQNFLQHAEHYTRMLGEAQQELMREQELRQGQQGDNRQQNAGGGYAGGGNGNGNGNGQPRFDQPRTEDMGHRGDETGARPSFYDEARAPQPLAVAGDDDGPGLVETPEASARPVVSGSDRRGEGRHEPRGDARGEGRGEPQQGQPKGEASGERRPRNQQRRQRGPRDGARDEAGAADGAGGPGAANPADAPGGAQVESVSDDTKAAE